MLKKCTTDAVKTASKRAIQKKPEATRDFVGDKIGDKITKVSRPTQNNLETVKSEEIIPKERYTSPEERQ